MKSQNWQMRGIHAHKNEVLSGENMIDERLLIKRLETLKENLAKMLDNHKCLDKKLTVRLFDRLIEEINTMSKQ